MACVGGVVPSTSLVSAYGAGRQPRRSASLGWRWSKSASGLSVRNDYLLTRRWLRPVLNVQCLRLARTSCRLLIVERHTSGGHRKPRERGPHRRSDVSPGHLVSPVVGRVGLRRRGATCGVVVGEWSGAGRSWCSSSSDGQGCACRGLRGSRALARNLFYRWQANARTRLAICGQRLLSRVCAHKV